MQLGELHRFLKPPELARDIGGDVDHPRPGGLQLAGLGGGEVGVLHPLAGVIDLRKVIVAAVGARAVAGRGLHHPRGLLVGALLIEEAAELQQDQPFARRRFHRGPIGGDGLVGGVQPGGLTRGLHQGEGVGGPGGGRLFGSLVGFGVGFDHAQHVQAHDLIGGVGLVIAPGALAVGEDHALIAREIVDVVVAPHEGFHRRALHRLGIGVGGQDVAAGEGGVHGHGRDGDQHAEIGRPVGAQQGVDRFQALEDLRIVQQVELEPPWVQFAGRRRRNAVQVMAGIGVEPGLRHAQGHDEHPRLAGQGHVVVHRLAALEHLFQGGRGHQRVHVRIVPAVAAHVDQGLGLERRAVPEAPLQLVGDAGHHIAVQGGVGIGLQAHVGRQPEMAGRDVVALGGQLLFDVAGEAGADGEDQLAAVDLEGRPESRLRQGHQPLGLGLGRPRPTGILLPKTLEGFGGGRDQKGHKQSISKRSVDRTGVARPGPSAGIYRLGLIRHCQPRLATTPRRRDMRKGAG